MNSRRKIMSKRVASILPIRLAAMVIIFSGCGTWARADDDLPPPIEPSLAESGDWAADFNEAQIACYNGSMSACDSIHLNSRVLFDTFLHNYGRSCGGRVDLVALRRAESGRSLIRCTEIFPGHE
jgi:hypothetical protein